MQFLNHIGQYILLLREVFRKPERPSIYLRQIITEIDNLGIKSLGIVIFISVFMGAVVALQLAYNIDMPLIPVYTIGFSTRQSVILEFSPTVISLILAGKVGSSIASEIGTMRVTEQIDALEIMGINPATYLIFPKIIASVVINPILMIASMFMGVFGGYLACFLTPKLLPSNYIYGIQSFFNSGDIFYSLLKTVVFAFIIASISGYHGYQTRGGAREVGDASTKAVVASSITIIICNLILTQLLIS